MSKRPKPGRHHKISREMFEKVREEIRSAVTERVKRSRSIRDLWILYRDTWAARHNLDVDDPEIADVFVALEGAFYAGASTVWELIFRVAPAEVSEAQGEAMLTRISDELDAYAARDAQA